jgi:cytochrome c peroxidase
MTRTSWWLASFLAALPLSAVPFIAAPAVLSPAARVGKALFFDRSLSASGRMSCATCHDPAYAYGPQNDLAVQPGGPGLTDRGTRAVPSLRYSEYTPPYSDLLDNPDGISQPGPGGGLTLDGRAPTLADQARIPLLRSRAVRPARPPLPDSAKYCGMFKTPTLRNAAIRKTFFHNGAMTSLRNVIRFYNTRDTSPELWYPVVDGVVQKFDDLPAPYRGNIDAQAPLDGRARHSSPAMSDQDVEDLLAFLQTLTDADLVARVR